MQQNDISQITEPSTESGSLPMLGKYQLIREIARSNDIVYEGIDTQIGRRVAVKELNLPPSLSEAARQQRIDRFYREARAAGAMNHPNIVTIHEVGEENGRHYLAMEFLEGGTLRQRLTEKGSLSEAEATMVGIALCDALSYAHERGVIHRDVKPDNVFVSETPDENTHASTLRVKLTDFGIARITHEETMTATGQFFGTPSYMSPEQLSGLSGVDARSDLFSLGIMLWEMVIGRKPFTGDSVPNTMFRILNDPTPSTNDHAPALEPVILKATAKNPAARYLSAGEMRSALVTALESSRYGNEGGIPPVAETLSKPSTMEKGYVLSVELVDFDQIAKPLRERLVGGLQSVALATEEAKKAKADKRLLCRTAPGGLLIAFFNGDPLSPIRCAVELDKSFHITVASLAQQLTIPLNLRMGIASGGVVYSDNFQEETTGEGVTVTQRIARLGGGAHGGNILVSANVAAEALKSQTWSERLFDLGFCDAGEGMRIHLYNLQGFGYGSVGLPPGLSPKAPALPIVTGPLEPIQAAPLPLSRGARTALIVFSLLALLGVVGWRSQTGLAKIADSARRTYREWQAPKPLKSQTSSKNRTRAGTSRVSQPRAGRPASASYSANIGSKDRVRVPKLTGMSQDAAFTFLEAAGLSAADSNTVPSKSVPEGIVFRQRPAAGTRVPPRTLVYLTVSLGPDTSDAPESVSAPADESATPTPEETIAPDVVETPAEDTAEPSPPE